MKLTQSEIFQIAHQITRDTLEFHGPADYRATFGACLKFVLGHKEITKDILIKTCGKKRDNLAGDKVIFDDIEFLIGEPSPGTAWYNFEAGSFGFIDTPEREAAASYQIISRCGWIIFYLLQK